MVLHANRSLSARAGSEYRGQHDGAVSRRTGVRSGLQEMGVGTLSRGSAVSVGGWERKTHAVQLKGSGSEEVHGDEGDGNAEGDIGVKRKYF